MTDPVVLGGNYPSLRKATPRIAAALDTEKHTATLIFYAEQGSVFTLDIVEVYDLLRLLHGQQDEIVEAMWEHGRGQWTTP